MSMKRGEQVEEFDAVYKENYRRVYYYLRNICGNDRLAEDLTQETFYNVLLSICNGRAVTVCTQWLVKIAHNVFIDYLRKSKMDLESLETHMQGMETPAVDQATRMDFINMLNRLPIRYKMIILLKDHYGFSYHETAEILGCSESAVKVTLFRARNKFKEVYADDKREGQD